MLSAQLFGQPSFSYQGIPVHLRGKTALLVAYLAYVQKPVARQELLHLLWPAGKTHNLRQSLAALRQQPGAAQWLNDTATTIQIYATTDIKTFRLLANENTAEALEIAEGKLLDANLSDCPDLEQWCEQERIHLSQFRQTARRMLATKSLKMGHYLQAKACLQDLLCDDPLDEDATQQLMELHLQKGEQDQAAEVYGQLKRELAALGTQPHPQTTALLGLERDYPELLAQARALLPKELGPGSAALWSRVVGLPEQEVAQWLTVNVPAVAPPPQPLAMLWHNRLATTLIELDERPVGVSQYQFLLLIAEQWEKAKRKPEAGKAFTEAGKEALRIGQNKMALAAYERALECTEAEHQLELLTKKANLLETLGQFDELLKLSKTLSDYSKKWENNLALLTSLITQGIVLIQRNKIKAMAKVSSEADKVLKQLKREKIHVDPTLRSQVHSMSGIVLLKTGELHKAQAAFRKGLAYASSDDLRLHLMINLGKTYTLQGKLQEALRTQENCLSLAREAGNIELLAQLLIDVGDIAEKLGHFDKAAHFYQEGSSLASQLGMSSVVQMAYRNSAALYLRQGQFGHAWKIAEHICEHEQLAPDHKYFSHVLLAEIEWLCGDFQAAKQRIHRLQSLEETQQDPPTERLVMLLNCCEAILDVLLDQNSLKAQKILQEIHDAGHTDMVWNAGLDVLIFQQNPIDMRRLLDWLGEPPAEYPEIFLRFELVHILLAWREDQDIDTQPLYELSQQFFIYSTYAARLLHQIEKTEQTQQNLQNLAVRQSQELPRKLKLHFLEQIQMPFQIPVKELS